MITDTAINVKGAHVLAKYLGVFEAEHFIALIQREPFDYCQRQPESAIKVAV